MAGEDVCEACGERNPIDSAFCLYCGVYLGWNERTLDETSAGPEASAPGPAPAGPGHQPAQPQPGGPPPQPEPATTAVQPAVGPGPVRGGAPTAYAPGEAPCPTCGRVNEPGRRFCGKCGQVLQAVPTAAGSGPTPTRRSSWWTRLFDPADRRARRDYRRSLPAWYRWRRWLITLLVIALVVIGCVIVGKNPVGWAKARWYDLRDTTVAVTPVQASSVPPHSALAGRGAGKLVDGTSNAWVTSWPPKGANASPPCGGLVGVGRARLEFPPTRIRGIEINAGPNADEADSRQLQFVPKRVDVIAGGRCLELADLENVPESQKRSFDTGQPVDQLVLAVATAYAPTAKTGTTPTVQIREVTLLARPD